MIPPSGEAVTLAIGDCLRKNQLPIISTNAKGVFSVKTMGVCSRLWHWHDARFHEERLSALAAQVAKTLAAKQRISIEAAANDATLNTARKLIKSTRQYPCRTSQITALKKEILAVKLGIDSKTLDSNPGLCHFAESTHLDRYLLNYGHTLQVDPTTLQIQILKEGKLTPWSEALQEIQQWQKSTHQPSLPWVYGQNGIQNKDMYDWTELKPYKKADPAEWNYQYIFEFCACFNPESVKNGNHSWLRLKTPSGDIYSIGLYRPDKPDWTHNFKTPFRVKPGHLMQPDVSEFWDFDIFTIDVAITEKAFLEMKRTIEEDKHNEDLVFQLFNNNCLLYCKKIAALGDVNLPTLEHALQFITPPTIVEQLETTVNRLPACIQKVCHVVTAFFANILQVMLGACIIDPSLNAQQKQNAVPHLQKISDLFNPEKTYLNHPNTLAFKTREEVLKWRKKEIEEIKNRDTDRQSQQARINTIRFSLPPASSYSSFISDRHPKKSIGTAKIA